MGKAYKQYPIHFQESMTKSQFQTLSLPISKCCLKFSYGCTNTVKSKFSLVSFSGEKISQSQVQLWQPLSWLTHQGLNWGPPELETWQPWALNPDSSNCCVTTSAFSYLAHWLKYLPCFVTQIQLKTKFRTMQTERNQMPCTTATSYLIFPVSI